MFCTFQTSKIRFILIISIFLSITFSYGQDSIRSVLEPDFLFKYDLEELEHEEDGITIFDQYCEGLAGKIKIRKDRFNDVLDKEHIDFYGNGKMLHKGFYDNGALIHFKNYFPNSQVERDLRVKKNKPKELTCYYMFGEIRERMVFDDGILMLHEKYHYSGRLKYLMEISDIGYLKIEQWNDEDGTPLKYIELINEDSLIYEMAEMYSSGTVKEKGKYTYDPKIDTFQRDGKMVKYSETGTLTAEVIYEDDVVIETIVEEKSEVATSTKNNMSNIPAEYVAFDLNVDGEISLAELNESVNAFFDEDSTMTIEQLNGLVNYFFEQD